MDEVHLSRDAFERLREESDWRSGARRDEISQWIERAREHGAMGVFGKPVDLTKVLAAIERTAA